MSAQDLLPPAPEDGPQLYRRLCAGDPVAPSDLARTYLPPLIAWLCQTNRRLAPEYCTDAAEQAIMDLIRRPASYNPERQQLTAYLRMAATADLRNLLRREKRYHRRRRDWESVEHSTEPGKYLGREDDPALRLCIAEAEAEARARVPDSVWASLIAAERRALELLLQGERRTEVFAQECGLAHLAKAEREREVKRLKDRVKARVKRAGGGDV
jgi:hypothetical protein